MWSGILPRLWRKSSTPEKGELWFKADGFRLRKCDGVCGRGSSVEGDSHTVEAERTDIRRPVAMRVSVRLRVSFAGVVLKSVKSWFWDKVPCRSLSSGMESPRLLAHLRFAGGPCRPRSSLRRTAIAAAMAGGTHSRSWREYSTPDEGELAPTDEGWERRPLVESILTVGRGGGRQRAGR